MAVVFKDRVRETSASTGTGDFTLAGAVEGYQGFNAAFGTGQPFYYVIELDADWEIGTGELSDATTLERTSVIASSNSNNAVNFPAGTKNVFSSVPAAYLNTVLIDSSPFRFTSQNSQLQFTSQMSDYLGTGASQSFRFTSQNSQIQFTSQMSDYLGTGATQSFRHTSADSQLQFTSANTKFAGINGAITGGSITVNTSGVSVNLPSYLTTAMLSNAATISNINVSGGTTSSNLSNIKFIDSQGVSWSLDTGSKLYATVRTDYQSSGNYLTTAMASNRGSDFVQANATIAGTSISGTIASNGMSLSVGPYLTTADLSQNSSKYNQNWKLTGNTGGTTSSAQGTDVWYSGGNSITISGSSNSIVFSVGNYLTTAALSQDSSKYAGTAGAITNGSITVNTSGVSINLPAYLTTADLSANSSKYVQNWKITGNTAGTTSSAQGTDIWFQGGNSITVSGSSNSLVFSVGAYLTTAALSGDTSKYNQNWKLTNNTAGTTSSAQGTDVWYGGSNGITASGSNATIVFAGPPHHSYFRFEDPTNTVTTSCAQSTSHFAPFELPWNASYDRMRVVASGSVAASSTQATTGNTSLSMSAVTSHNIVIYSRGAGANSQSLQFLTSTQVVDQCSMRISYAANSTQYSVTLRYSLGNASFTKDYSSSVNSINYHTSHLTDLTGVKYLDIPMGLSLPPGQFWVGYGRSTTMDTQANSISVGTRLNVSHNSMLAISMNTLAMGMLGGDTNSSVAWRPGHGSFTTNGVAGTTNSLGLDKVSSASSNNAMYIQFMRIT